MVTSARSSLVSTFFTSPVMILVCADETVPVATRKNTAHFFMLFKDLFVK
jgi:hypothetical protein